MKIVQKIYPHLAVVLGFVIVALLYFYPVLQGKQIYQSDIVQYTGMAKEQNDFRTTYNQEPYWTDAAFGGMPTYQLGAKYPHNYIGKLDSFLRFLPRPADYLFLYFLGFYVLLLVLKTNPLKAFFGAIAFGFSTYLIIILGVGHNAKAHAIAYMPMVIAGFVLVFKQNYIRGGLLTLFALALEINANHFQMTYYLGLFLIILSIYFIYKSVTQKETKSLLRIFGILAIAGILALGANATNLLATSEYAPFSTRSKSHLTYNSDGSKITGNSALSKDYITEYSYGIAESFNLIAPRLFGGSNAESLDTNCKMYQMLIERNVPDEQATDFITKMPTYWGNQPIVAAPAYIGAIVFFLAILGLFLNNNKIKYAFLVGAIFSLLLSWGKNFSFLTNLFIDFVPMYNKFRAVSSIQVILELCLPVLAVMGLQSFFETQTQNQRKALLKTSAISLGTIIVLFLSKGMFYFTGANDDYYIQEYGPEFVDALKSDRKSMYSADLLRSGFFILIAILLLWFFIKEKLSKTVSVVLVGFLMLLDLFFVDKKYVSAKDFVSKSEMQTPFTETPSDTQILKDTTHYRVFEINGNMSSARASYFHKSIGGYHAAKPQRMQQLFDYQITKSNVEVLNMLNVKYVIQSDKEGNEFPTQNPQTNGNAWFIENIKTVVSADDEMKALDKFDSKKTAIVNTNEFAIQNKNFVKDTAKTNIKLNFYHPNHLKYTTQNPNEGFAVFSEIYYKNGWIATIDNKETSIVRADYTLRGLLIPAGKHIVEFKFEPQVVKIGSKISLACSVLMLFLLIGGIYFEGKNRGNVSKTL